MKSFRPIAALSVALAAVLVGCADSSSTSEFDPLFNVTNKTTERFSKSTIVDAETGATYHSGTLACGAGQSSCPIYYTGPAISTPVDFIFHDERGMVAAAYKLGAAPDAFTGLEVSARTTGYYLIDQLLRRSADLAAMPQSQREAIAYTFTQNYTSADGATDYHEEMAAHYAYRTRRSGLAVAQFLDDLAGRLLAGEVAGEEEFSLPVMAPVGVGSGAQAAAQSTDDSCSTAASNLLVISGAVAFGVQNAFPIGGTVMSAAVGLAQAACDDTSTKLDAIDSKLNQLQLSLDSLSDGLGELRSFTAGVAINAGEDAFQTLSQNVERLASLAAISPVQYLVWGDTPYFTTGLRYTQSNRMSVLFALQGVNFSRLTAGDYRVQLVCVTADCSVVEGLNGNTPGANRGLSFIDGLSNLTIGDYGARISASDFGGSRELYGFFVKRDGQYVPLYER